MSKTASVYYAAAMSLALAGMCCALPAQADGDDAPPAAAQETRIEENNENAEVQEENAEKEGEEAAAQALPENIQIEFKNEGDYVIQPDSMAYHNFTTFIYNDFDYFLRRDPRIVKACLGTGDNIDMTQKMNEYFDKEEELTEISEVIFQRIVGLDRGWPARMHFEETSAQPNISLLGVNQNVLYKIVNFWSGRGFENYREEYMRPYREGEFRFTEKFRAQVRERKGNGLRGWTKKMSLADLSICAASTPIAIFMDTDEKRIRERNAWMPTPLEDFMYYSSRHSFPYVGFLDYSLKFFDENGKELDIAAGERMPAKGGKIICSWDKLTLFELDDIIKADRN
ncbi:hypothetical protein IJT93_11415 [bacterium]|nr:hypothetical protein [bacterium]